MRSYCPEKLGNPGFDPPNMNKIAKYAHFFTLGPIYEKLAVIFFPCYSFVCSVMRSYCPENLVTLGLMYGSPRTPQIYIFSSAVPPGSGAFQMPTRPSSSASASAASASTLRGGRANLRNASVTFSLFLHEASLG